MERTLKSRFVGLLYGMRVWNLLLVHMPVSVASYVILHVSSSMDKVLSVILSVLLAAGGGYLFNNYVDAPADAVAGKRVNPVVMGILNRGFMLRSALAMYALSIGLGILSAGYASIVLLLIIVLGSVYSLFFKRRPFLDFLVYSTAAGWFQYTLLPRSRTICPGTCSPSPCMCCMLTMLVT